MAAATTAVESSSVSEANSVDDILVTDTTSAKAALAVIDSALDMMSDFRAMLGAASNRMFITVDNLMSMSENTGAAPVTHHRCRLCCGISQFSQEPSVTKSRHCDVVSG